MRLIAVGLVLLLITGALARRAAKQCTKTEAIAAEQEAESLKTWDQIYHSYNRFSHCDDAAIAEGYSESVTKLLADDWNSFNRLLSLTNRNTAFRAFVLKHLDDTVPADRLAKIANHARSNCPAKGRSLCVSIAKAAGE